MKHSFTIEGFVAAASEPAGCIVVGTYPEFSGVLFDAIYKYDLGKKEGRKHMLLSELFDTNSWPPPQQPLIIASYPYIRTLNQLKEEKRILEYFCQQIEGRDIVLLHSLDHPLLVNSSLVYPEKMLRLMLKSKENQTEYRRARFVVPKNPWIQEEPVNISIRKMLPKEDWRRMLFDAIGTCLFPPDRYQKVERVKDFKGNVFLVEVKLLDGNLASRYEVIKVDSIWKISNEKRSFDLIKTNLTGGSLYQVLDSISIVGEFVGGIRSCVESSSELKMFEVFGVGELFEKYKKPSTLKKVIKQLPYCLNSIYNLAHKNRSEPSFPVYRKRILPYVMDIFFQYGLKFVQPVDEDSEVSILSPNFRAISNYKKEDYIFKLLEIAPDIDFRDRCTLLLEARDINGQAFHIRCPYYSPGWRESFIKIGIFQGQHIAVSRIRQLGIIFQLFEHITSLDIVFGLHPINKKTKNDRISDITKFDIKMKDSGVWDNFISEPKLTFSTGSTPNLEDLWNPLYLLDLFSKETESLLKEEVTGPAHGDLNLDNILVYTEKKDKNNPIVDDDSGECEKENILEIKLIDLASFATDYPLAFDYVKLEAEIKNHILAHPKWIRQMDDFSNREIKGKFVDFVFQFEERLWEHDVQQIWPETWVEELKTYIEIIKDIRQMGLSRYKDYSGNALILYQQQLFFYSLRTLTYRKVRNWGKLWAFLGAIVASNHLNIAP